MKCPKCQTDNSDTAKFCKKCGQSLLTELLLEHYLAEKKEALEHLDFSIKEFREMKMQPSLERALRHKDILKA